MGMILPVHSLASVGHLQQQWTPIVVGFVSEKARMGTMTPRLFGSILPASVLVFIAATIAGAGQLGRDQRQADACPRGDDTERHRERVP